MVLTIILPEKASSCSSERKTRWLDEGLPLKLDEIRRSVF